ncbi:alpha/beta hydrolase family protein [Paenibacillus xylanilyticus]|uniref:alpha/beta hydrolase family protein n=1 Tax=Paenibacillus xylanilyticus TaxID=248903 RepID=UPI00399EFCB1
MKRDIRKMMALLSEANVKEQDLPFSVEKRDIEIPFISKNGTVRRRPLRIYVPETGPTPKPLVFIAHYEMPENDATLNLYLRKGWAVSTPIDFQSEYNGNLIDDDLIFNSAALSAVRKQPDMDRTRIVVSGGSAGGYMTQMLSVLHLGICCSVSFSGITNILFNMKYLQSANEHNKEILETLTADERKDFIRCLEVIPVPIIGAIFGQFAPILAKIQENSHGEIWKALSPSCMARCFTGPVLFSHFTSDLLVPIDQLTKRFTYAELDKSLPDGFRIRMSEFPLEEELQRSMAEMLPAGDLFENLCPPPQTSGENFKLSFDLSKRFNILVFDEGNVEAEGGHYKKMDLGSIDATAYIQAQLQKSSRETNWLTAGKLALMAERYAGKGFLIPGQAGIDDTVYGSVAMNCQEILEELSEFGELHPEEFADTLRTVMTARPDLADALGEIKNRLLI